MQRLCDWVKGRSISVSYIYIYIYWRSGVPAHQAEKLVPASYRSRDETRDTRHCEH